MEETIFEEADSDKLEVISALKKQLRLESGDFDDTLALQAEVQELQELRDAAAESLKRRDRLQAEVKKLKKEATKKTAAAGRAEAEAAVLCEEKAALAASVAELQQRQADAEQTLQRLPDELEEAQMAATTAEKALTVRKRMNQPTNQPTIDDLLPR